MLTDSQMEQVEQIGTDKPYPAMCARVRMWSANQTICSICSTCSWTHHPHRQPMTPGGRSKSSGSTLRTPRPSSVLSLNQFFARVRPPAREATTPRRPTNDQ